jgi:putative membrane protein
MTLDLILAIGHHILVFGLAIMLATELARLRPGLTGANLTSLARLDAGYGATAGLILVVGVLRVIYGVKGAAYYLPNPWFWGKMAAFAAIGLISIAPTITFLKWRKAQVADAGFTPTDAEVARTRGYLVWQVGLLLVVVSLAAAMARLG